MGTTKEFKFSNGDEVVEKITGFKGIITGTCFYLTGCNQYLITPRSKDGTDSPDGVWYDEGRVILVEKKFSGKDVSAEDNGCDKAPTQGKRGS